jgi:phosphoglycolate phosphatase
MIKYVIFDFDGTLADSKEVFISVYNQIAARKGYRQIESGNLEYLRSLSIPERCKYLKVPIYRIPFMATEFLSLYKTELQQVKLFGGIKELLAGLNAIGCQTAIISSNAEQNIASFLSSNNVESVATIYCKATLFGKDKLIAKFLKKYGLNASQVLYVGDETRDIIACQKVGVKIAWVEWGYDTKEAAAAVKPDYLVSSPGEILSIVKASEN